MIAPDPWLQPELRALRRHLFTVIAMLVLGCGVLAFGWRNAEQEKDDLRADKDAMVDLYVRAFAVVDSAQAVMDTLRAGLSDENRRVFLLGSRKLLGIPAPPEAGR